jgi:hypothetical protein
MMMMMTTWRGWWLLGTVERSRRTHPRAQADRHETV